MIGVLHTSPLFYLTVLLVGGGTFVIDMFIHAFQFNLQTSPQDFLRKVVSRKVRFEDHKEEFDEIMAKIEKQNVAEDIEREAYLEKKREELGQKL